jgi:hypothetical protein
MRGEPKRWAVSRLAFGRPYRIALERGMRQWLEIVILEFCMTPRNTQEIEAMLEERTDCPKEHISALKMTVCEGLFLSHRTGRGEKMLDNTFFEFSKTREPIRHFTTQNGANWLAKMAAQREANDGDEDAK